MLERERHEARPMTGPEIRINSMLEIAVGWSNQYLEQFPKILPNFIASLKKAGTDLANITYSPEIMKPNLLTLDSAFRIWERRIAKLVEEHKKQEYKKNRNPFR